jgi:hypothetical protein
MNKIKINNNSILLSTLIIFCLISLFGGIVYRVYALNNIGVAISLILAAISFFIIQRFKTKDKRPSFASFCAKATDGKQQTTGIKKNISPNNGTMKQWNNKMANLFLFMPYFLLIFSCFYILFLNQTAGSIISPWQLVPAYFFAIYTLATAVLIIIIIKNNSKFKIQNSKFIISIHYFLSFSIALIIYKIGYGFDPFIHQATVDLIDKIGSVDPKPFYYLGQYALLVIIHKITFLPLVWLDKLLVPLLAAVYLPITVWRVLSKWFDDKKSIILTTLLLLALPFSFFIVTTPQNFAYLLLLIIILLGLICDNIFDLTVVYLLSLTALIIQPIAGIPALLFSLLLTVYHSDVETSHGASLKKFGYALIFTLSAISLPLAFVILSEAKDLGESASYFSASITTGFLAAFRMIIPGQENFILNFIYLYGFNIKIIIGIIAAVGLIIAYRHRGKCEIFFIYLIMAASLALAYLLTAKLPFSFLIDYERSNYPNRIMLIAAFFLLPFILTALYGFIHQTLKQKKSIKIPLLLFMAVLTTASLYLSYPRFDHYFNARGYSTGQNDIDAVHWIEDNASQDYIVLANQQVSAAALREFGFKKYYNMNYKLRITNYELPAINQKLKIFYYPIPTGGILYQYYLDMVYKKPAKETMIKAMELAGVKEGYFVLNKYWWAFPKLLEEAKLEADSWEEIDRGRVYIFKYAK